jgi:type IV pilus assembly protein PilM
MPPALRELFKKPNLLTRHFGKAPSIGLFMGSDTINLVQMEEAPQYPRIRAMASVTLPKAKAALLGDAKSFRKLIDQVRRSHPFSGNRVVTSLSANDVKISMVAYKRQKGQSEENSLVAELRERMQSDLDDHLVDFIGVRQSESNGEFGEALVAMAPRQRVLSYLECLSNAGLEVTALDVGPNALSRLVHHSGAQNWKEFPSLPNALLINVGEQSSYLTVIWGRRLILDRPIEFSEARLLARLGKILGMPEDLALHVLHHMDEPDEVGRDTTQAVLEVLHSEIQALQQEINKTLVYMASKTRGKSVDALHLAGRAARYPGLLSGVQDALRVKVFAINPITMFADRGGRPALDPALGVRAGIVLATGLALHEVPERGAWT